MQLYKGNISTCVITGEYVYTGTHKKRKWGGGGNFQEPFIFKQFLCP